MDSYVKHNINITKNQARRIIKALNDLTPLNMRISHNQLKTKKGGMVPMLLTPPQLQRLVYAQKHGQGMMLNLSKDQLDRMRTDGGVIPILAALAPVAIALLSGAAGYAGTKIAETIDKEFISKGNGLYPLSVKPNKKGGCLNCKKGGCVECTAIKACPKCGFNIGEGLTATTGLYSSPVKYPALPFSGKNKQGKHTKKQGKGIRPIGTGSKLFPNGVKRV